MWQFPIGLPTDCGLGDRRIGLDLMEVMHPDTTLPFAYFHSGVDNGSCQLKEIQKSQYRGCKLMRPFDEELFIMPDPKPTSRRRETRFLRKDEDEKRYGTSSADG